jgi:hypothetical protein
VLGNADPKITLTYAERDFGRRRTSYARGRLSGRRPAERGSHSMGPQRPQKSEPDPRRAQCEGELYSHPPGAARKPVKMSKLSAATGIGVIRAIRSLLVGRILARDGNPWASGEEYFLRRAGPRLTPAKS